MAGSSWTEWSKYLIEGMKSMRQDINEIYETLHAMDAHHNTERHNLLSEIIKEINLVRQEHQKDINTINLEMTKIQVKMAFWSSLVAGGGAVVGSVSIYLIKSWLASSAVIPHKP